MHRPLLALLVAMAAPYGCGVEKDDRPLELEYLTAAIFAPSCAATQCHSTFAKAEGLVFDTVEGTRSALVDTELLRFDFEKPDPQFPEISRLIRLISWTNPIEGESVPRMPFDAPIPDKDVDLLVTWIKAPNVQTSHGEVGEGARARGAQCNPDRNDGFACDQTQVRVCGKDWNFGDVAADCANGCSTVCLCDQPNNPNCPNPDQTICPKVACPAGQCQPTGMCRL